MDHPPSPDPSEREFALVRHGESAYNVAGLLNGDPRVAVELTPVGRAQAEALAARLAGVRIDAAVHTGFVRTAQTLEILLADQTPPITAIADLGDIRVGIFEGAPVTDYRDWRADHRDSDAPPGGESRIESVARFAVGYRAMRDLEGATVLAVLHDITIRFLMNAAAGADPITGPITRVRNCEVHRLSLAELDRGIETLTRRAAGRASERYPVR